MMKKNFTSSLKQSIIIYGSGGHATSVASATLDCGYEITCFIDNKRKGEKLLDIEICDDADLKEIANTKTIVGLIVAIGHNFIREKVYRDIARDFKNIFYPKIIHPSAIISKHSEIGDGSVILPGAVIGPNSSIGKFCIVNTRSSIDHDCMMHDFSSIAPGVITGGNVEIGVRSFIGLNTAISHKVNIGSDSVIGGMSFVNKNVDGNFIVYGNPARKVRPRKRSDPYL